MCARRRRRGWGVLALVRTRRRTCLPVWGRGPRSRGSLGSPRLRRCGVVLNSGEIFFPPRDMTFITRGEHDTRIRTQSRRVVVVEDYSSMSLLPAAMYIFQAQVPTQTCIRMLMTAHPCLPSPSSPRSHTAGLPDDSDCNGVHDRRRPCHLIRRSEIPLWAGRRASSTCYGCVSAGLHASVIG
jgi:hypothetical protein